MADTASHGLAIPSRLTAIDDARRWASAHARPAGFGEDDVYAVELALTEALANVIEYSYAGDPGCEIELSLALDDERLTLTIRDNGLPFDEASYVPPDLDVPATEGYGVFLVGELMDEIARESAPGGGTLLKLVKYRSRPSAAGSR